MIDMESGALCSELLMQGQKTLLMILGDTARMPYVISSPSYAGNTLHASTLHVSII